MYASKTNLICRFLRASKAHKRLYISYVLKWDASAVFLGGVLSGDGGIPRERVLQQTFEFSGEVG